MSFALTGRWLDRLELRGVSGHRTLYARSIAVLRSLAVIAACRLSAACFRWALTASETVYGRGRYSECSRFISHLS